ncbi:MAG: hypothetical protein IJ772_05135 [Bacilli bacterium]|nr:hypothetical protein [Bacilli bacterium]
MNKKLVVRSLDLVSQILDDLIRDSKSGYNDGRSKRYHEVRSIVNELYEEIEKEEKENG